jgi:Leucine-rich repeat (LRR) protein
MIYNMPNLKNLNFQGNLLTDIPANAFMNVSSLETINFSYNKLTTFELWPLDVNTSADFSNNQISTITNKYFFDQFNTTNTPTIYLTNNSPSINFTDAVYEMYNQCEEVYQWFYGNFGVNTPLPLFTRKLAFINFGTMQINCSYDQVYFLKILQDDPYTYGLPTLPIKTATCINSSQNINNTLFFNSTYATYAFDVNSTVNFSIVYPRFCKVQVDEEGGLTTIANISAPSSNIVRSIFK